jgi:hypothetical protein
VFIRLLPERAALAAIARKFSASKRAYPVLDVAQAVLSSAGACFARIEWAPGAGDGRPFHQCSLCGCVALSPETLQPHFAAAHWDRFFAAEETVGEPPAGQFSCVCRCGLSGELIGPPNHHTFGPRLQEVLRTRFPHLSMDAYRQKLETVRDPALIEQWREQSRRQVQYRLKDASGNAGEPLTRAAAEAHFRAHIAPGLQRPARRASVPLRVIASVEDRPLREAIEQAIERERRFPFSLMLSVRLALKHMGFHAFKTGAGKGIVFVTAVVPSALDTNHAVPELRAVILHLHQHPGCTRSELLEALKPGATADAEEGREALRPLSWLIERGHVIEFFNGALSVPLPAAPAEEPGERA